MRTKFKGRQVEITDVDYAVEIEDVAIIQAYWCDVEDDDKALLTDDELWELTQASFEWLYEEWVQHKVCAAEAWADSLEDR